MAGARPNRGTATRRHQDYRGKSRGLREARTW